MPDKLGVLVFRKPRKLNWRKPQLFEIDRNEEETKQLSEFERSKLQINDKQVEICKQILESHSYEFLFDCKRNSFFFRRCLPLGPQRTVIFDFFQKRTITIEQQTNDELPSEKKLVVSSKRRSQLGQNDEV